MAEIVESTPAEPEQTFASLDDIFANVEANPPAEEEVEAQAEAPETPAQEAPAEALAAPETPAAPPPVPPPVQDDTALQMARLAAQERVLADRRREEQELLTQLEARARDVATREQKAREWEKFIEAMESGDPLAALQSKGIDLEKLNQAAVNGVGLRPNRKLEEEVAKTRQELQAFQQAQIRAQQEAAVARQWEEARLATAREVQARSPLLAASGDEAVELVLALAQEEQSRGVTPTYERVIATAESRMFALLDKVMAVDAVKARYTPTANSDTSSAAKGATPRTVSNAAAGNPAAVTQKPDLLDLDADQAFDFLMAQGHFAG